MNEPQTTDDEGMQEYLDTVKIVHPSGMITYHDPDQEWLWVSQTLLHNIRGWLARGQTETAMREIDDYWRRWREAHDAKP